MEYTKLFETVYNESIKLQETTVKADLSLLDAQLENDTELKTLLNTPAKDLPEKYKYLVDEIYEDEADKTLYYVIKESCNRLKSTSFFSMAGNKIVGKYGNKSFTFCAYYSAVCYGSGIAPQSHHTC